MQPAEVTAVVVEGIRLSRPHVELATQPAIAYFSQDRAAHSTSSRCARGVVRRCTLDTRTSSVEAAADAGSRNHASRHVRSRS
jgi:hypothetical protein